ncbi:MAG: heparan-alpha-glucosaminide N-acetyltransferase domain-containing protein [Pyrinomonadaceae bacterium]
MNAKKIQERIYSIDFLRGVVMMLMLLDHTRDFVHHEALLTDPTDPATTTVPLFFTRWITHFCAPTFVFLSGVSIYLQKMNGKSAAELSRFLFTRGLWLIILEFTLVRFGFVFNLDYSFFGVAQVIWVIGLSMIVMAALVYLPLRIVGIFGIALIVLHNLFDQFQVLPAIAFGANSPPDLSQMLWMILHQPGVIPLFGGASSAFLAYPLIPWVGVMAAGYALGAIYSWDSARRRKWLLALGLSMCAMFVVIRYTNVYGDPAPWATEEQAAAQVATAAQDRPPDAPPIPPFEPTLSEPAFSILDFLNTQKYPPSLLYLLMTLGPSIIVLALIDKIDGKAIWQRIAITFGRVPMFYYLLQMPVAHLFGVVLSLLAGKAVGYYFLNFPANGAAAPPDHGFSLPVVYAAWIGGLIILYPLCYWYGNYKRKNKHWLLSYL